MARSILALALQALLLTTVAYAQQGGADAPVSPSEESDAAAEIETKSYAVGLNFGVALRKGELGLNIEQLLEGLEDGIRGVEGRITEQEAMVLNRQVFNEMRRRQQAERDALGARNKADGEAFLAANKEREGVVALPSGLQYEVLREGDGPQPAADDTATVHYLGTLIDGSVFDSSYDRGVPPALRPDSVIPGWTEALPLMSVGSKWKLFIPPDLAYGEAGSGSNIPPSATLVFEVELLSIEPRADDG